MTIEEEMKILSMQTRIQEKEEAEISTKYFPKVQLIDKDIRYSKSLSGRPRERFHPFWYN